MFSIQAHDPPPIHACAPYHTPKSNRGACNHVKYGGDSSGFVV
eukprot:CAMPEP_0201550366 /NCGR_PEP_ID=MMETSP0173_2-20130828/6744_1 /ASSEMBLY_ACC=CAM_ASM_000268 /TAXON_ID=218659 /ORGANISM="Vexillifera sp., Strain DIVA3 564/2" /LENGTH=42 /DNA_ID= /DNA_START= /DNA_END= /DNA_ORIENTATION=